ncbi:PAS domain S-box protein [Flaviaesturariibacter flavus]|uniref:histidine kinase n=1 Tax=Flaviaesturariibacter flavus TaxID=2502780 RepID=A0A4V2NVA1_9BACT|nr:PAS domain S-box protein [Flaviaesturariibacter flavus]TCJ12676.1 PAS domain S-box protein [Flaviaesturariibacter flavus]
MNHETTPTFRDHEALVSLPGHRMSFQTGTDLRVRSCNTLLSRFLGLPEDDVIGLDFSALPVPEEQGLARQLLENAANGMPDTGYLAFATPAGRKLGQITVVPQFHDGKPTGVFGFLLDATDRIEKTRMLIESEHRYRALLERHQFVSEATSDVLWDWNLETGDIYINQSIVRILGHEPPVAEAHRMWWEHLHPEDRERVVEQQQAAIKDNTRGYWQDHYRFVRPDGTVLHLEDRALIMRNEQGRAVRMVGAVHDVTSQKESELRIRRGERRFRAMVQSGLDVIVLLDRNFAVTYISPNAHKLGGYHPDEMMGVVGFEAIHPDDFARVLMVGQDISKTPEVLLPPFRFRAKNGSYRWVEAILVNHLHDPDIEAVVINMRDITERKEIEETILLSEEKYRLLFYQSPVPKWIFNRETLHFVEVNEAALDHYGYTREEFLAMSVLDLQPQAERKRVQRMLLSPDFLPAGRLNNISQHLVADGRTIWVELTLHGIYLEEGYHVMAIANDVTEKRALEQKVLREKINTQKEIARTIINTQEKERSEISKELHDNVNQLLTTAKLYIENIRYYPDQSAGYIDKSAGLLQKAITEIRNLSKALVTPVIYDIGFRATLEELIGQYRALNLFALDFQYTVPDDLIESGLRLTIYRILQEQLNNIVKHARATKVSIDIGNAGDKLTICISDNGVGFDTKAARSGLGINNMKNRIDVFQGSVDIDSAPNKGCSICIYFPLETAR